MTTIHLVSHTHWDREWYLPAVRFRQLLVDMVDELLDDPPTDGASFLLDAQTVVLDDYLAVRPERASELTALLKAGALEAGPWFVQADELMPSGEALVRNLLAGRRTLRSIGIDAPPVMYCPDTFGHPAALPVLARGFGCTSIIASRGYGGARWPAGDAVWWHGPDGHRVLFYHLSRTGYETAASLPADRDAMHARWQSMRNDLVPRSVLGAVLMMNGADHHARQQGLREAIGLLTDLARPDEVRASSLRAFGEDIAVRAAALTLPDVRGELRDSYGWMWTLQGTFASRAHQKRRNASLERMLTRDVEPWAALAARVRSRRPVVNAAWRSLLLCHPHDTICGCSTDEVARAMGARLDEAESQAAGIQRDALFGVLGHDPAEARVRRDEWKPVVVVRNRAPRARGGIALLKLTSFLADVKVGTHPAPTPSTATTRATPVIAGASAVQVLSRAVEHERTESPRHYPDDDFVNAAEVAAWIPEVPPYGVRCFEQKRGGKPADIPNPARVDGETITNGRVCVRVDADGRATFTDLEQNRTIADFVTWESKADLGDLYTPSPRGAKFAPAFAGARVLHRGPVRAAIETKWTLRLLKEKVNVRVWLVIEANARFARIHVEGANAASDHRLRVRIATDVEQPQVLADAMFGVVERVQPDVSPDEAKMELPLRSAPLHRYVSLFSGERGATVYSDGLAEYEADDAGGVFITLLRAVGELSRVDMPERPGHAGWPTATPEAQCHGPFGGEFAVMLHSARSATVIDEIERTADDVLLPLTGATLRSALTLPSAVHGIELSGEGLAFGAAKESDDGKWLVLRCVNLLDKRQAGAWRLSTPITEARGARLDETPGAEVAVSGDTARFTAGPREVVTLLVSYASAST
jgi:alpha-mannosidase